MSEELLSRRSVAELLGVHERTVSRNEQAWGLTPIPISNRSTKYRKSEVEAYLNRYRGHQPITPKEAENVVRSLLSAYHFDEDTAGKLQKVADLLASYQKGGQGR